MPNEIKVTRKLKMKPFFLSSRITILSIFLLFFIYACSNSTDPSERSSTDTGSIAFSVLWNRSPNVSRSVQSRSLNDCLGIDIVEAVVFTQDNQLLKSGEWPCSAHQGTITGVPVGSNRRVIVYGKNADDEIMYRGEENGIDISAGKTEVVDTIVAQYFGPNLLHPENGSTVALVDSTLQWDSVVGVKNYYIVVAEDSDFNSIIFEGNLISTTYSLTGLSKDQIYYWYVFALDHSGNIGVSTDVWNFTISSNIAIFGTAQFDAGYMFDE